MPNNKLEIKPELVDLIKELCETDRDIVLVSLCTTDGFAIKTFASKELSKEADKLAAMSSTISALSNSTSQQILKDEFETTIIESASGNMLFVSTQYLGFPSVLTLAARNQMALAIARYKTKALAQGIAEIS